MNGFSFLVPRKVLRVEFDDRPEEDEMFETEDDISDYDSIEDIFLPNLSGGQVNQTEPPIYLSSPDPPTRHQQEDQYQGFTNILFHPLQCNLILSILI